MDRLKKSRLLRLLTAVVVSLIATQMLFAMVLMLLPSHVSARYVDGGSEWIGLALFPVVFAMTYLLLARWSKQ